MTRMREELNNQFQKEVEAYKAYGTLPPKSKFTTIKIDFVPFRFVNLMNFIESEGNTKRNLQ